jgi:ATP-dependent Clp protease ATP-binding subunit ClpB
VVIMTSNLGSQYIAERAAVGDALDHDTQRRVGDTLRAHFKPEFLNRIDEILYFHALQREHLLQIVDIQLASLLRRLADRKIGLDLTVKARHLLVDEGYDPTYGARPLKRTIQRKLLDPLALALLEGRFADGDTIVVGAAGSDLSFERV